MITQMKNLRIWIEVVSIIIFCIVLYVVNLGFWYDVLLLILMAALSIINFISGFSYGCDKMAEELNKIIDDDLKENL